MSKKESVTKNNRKEKESINRIIAQKSKELLDWEVKNANQKWFFWLEGREQKLLKMTYLVRIKNNPELWREEYINNLRLADKWNTVTKGIIKNTPIKIR